ncbi:MAG: zinc-binding dehydrogenase [Ignavibacteriaceae bacterium]
MRAMVLPEFGGRHLFELREVDIPEIGVNEVLIKIIASAVNPVDAKIRANGYFGKASLPIVLGYDAAGIIEKVGDGVTDFKQGDEVYYTPKLVNNPIGTYAEYNSVEASIVALKPRNLSFEESAAIPLAGGTAWEAIVRRLKIQTGESILIHGAAGGVGTYAVQFAKASGAKVIATASPENHQVLRELGADVIIDYHKKDAAEVALAETGGKGVDAAFDIQGEEIVSRCLPGIRPFGRAACILPPKGDLTLLYRNNITLYGVFITRDKKRLDEMRNIFEMGLAKPVIDKVLSLEEVSKAHERMESHHGLGKIVLRVADTN